MRVLTVLGTRPQIVKAAPVSRALRAAGHEEILLVTGQHYDRDLVQVLREDSGLPAPADSLRVGSGSHGAQAAAAARGVARFAAESRPDCVLVAGDTNSALAAGLGARSAGVPLVHGEAGVRLGSFTLPEESNRVALDHLADLALCPTARAASALRKEAPRARVVDAGDPLLDAFLEARAATPARSPGTAPWILATIHRAQNTDEPKRLRTLVDALAALPLRVVFPVHPRTRRALETAGRWPLPAAIAAEDPLPHGPLLEVAAGAAAIVTDSGGLQREAYWLGVPCVLLRDDCEWAETVEQGWCALAGADPARIAAAAASPPRGANPPDLAAFGGGAASARWVRALEERFG